MKMKSSGSNSGEQKGSEQVKSISIEELAVFCKKKGFVFPNSEIYGGLAGFFDYGPLGVELKNNIKREWWKRFVQSRPDVRGIDGSILSHPKVWQASGHVEGFLDVLVECTKCHARVRADHLIEDELHVKAEGLHAEDMEKLILENKLKCQKCKAPFAKPKAFNLMFKTTVGPENGAEAYLRPETAQLIFTNFKNIIDTQRVKLPFGIAQTGKAFRNEIAPRDFLFRMREFEQMEIEFFTHPKKADVCPGLDPLLPMEIHFLSAKEQEKKNAQQKNIKAKELLKLTNITQWHAYWIFMQYRWLLELGINPEHLRIREHMQNELAHYATACFDIEYNFPFGWKEIYGNAARGTFDLAQHQKTANQKLEYFDEEAKERVLPVVASEPSQGVDRLLLTFLYGAYEYDEKRGNVVLKLHRKLAPFYVAVFPLVKNEESVAALARKVFAGLKDHYPAFYDEAASVGRRYARADEIGIPYCVTVDFDSLKDKAVTVRDRDTTKQIRVKVAEIQNVLSKLYLGEKFEKCGKVVETRTEGE